MIIWFTGLSGSGKSSLSGALGKKLELRGYKVEYVDGDTFRSKNKAVNKFSRKEIEDNNKRIIKYCNSSEWRGNFILVSVIAPFEKIRRSARHLFGEHYMEIFVNCPMDILIERDVKGLYKKAQNGEIDNLIGFSDKSPYDIPLNSDLEVDTSVNSVEEIVNKIMFLVQEKQKDKLTVNGAKDDDNC